MSQGNGQLYSLRSLVKRLGGWRGWLVEVRSLAHSFVASLCVTLSLSLCSTSPRAYTLYMTISQGFCRRHIDAWYVQSAHARILSSKMARVKNPWTSVVNGYRILSYQCIGSFDKTYGTILALILTENLSAVLLPHADSGLYNFRHKLPDSWEYSGHTRKMWSMFWMVASHEHVELHTQR